MNVFLFVLKHWYELDTTPKVDGHFVTIEIDVELDSATGGQSPGSSEFLPLLISTDSGAGKAGREFTSLSGLSLIHI